MFTEESWAEWYSKEINNYILEKGKKKYKKKGYVHFDNRFWFPDRHPELKNILKNELKVFDKTKKSSSFLAFSPFLKILLKTPRYRYQEIEGHSDLETKIRPICFASHIDSLIFGFYSHCLSHKYEEYITKSGFQECVLAYRTDLGKCNIQFSKEVFENITAKGQCTAIALDIKGYFDNIDHLTLKEKWQDVIGGKLPDDQFKIYQALTKYSYVSKNSLLKKFKGERKRNEKLPLTLFDYITGHKMKDKFQRLRDAQLIVTNNKPDINTGRLKGIPQGSAMSALLSNIYLLDFDKEMNQKAKNENFFYRRYCDDILIVCNTVDANSLKDFTIKKISLAPYYLIIQNKKVEIIDFRLNSKGELRAFKRSKSNINELPILNALNESKFYKSLQYLGFEFNGKNILIRSSSLSRYFRKMNARIIKTISMAYGSKPQSDKIFKKQIFNRYSHLGERNFISYALKASQKQYLNSNKIFMDGMNSTSIKRQLSRHITILKNTLFVKNVQRINYKELRKKQFLKKV